MYLLQLFSFQFLQDTLDALFGIMTESPHSDEYDEPVFNALVSDTTTCKT